MNDLERIWWVAGLPALALVIQLILTYAYANFKEWKNDYYRDKDLLMRKERLLYRIYRLFL